MDKDSKLTRIYNLFCRAYDTLTSTGTNNLEESVSKDMLEDENKLQHKVADDKGWLLAKRLELGDFEDHDSRQTLEQYGFRIVDDKDELFYGVTEPNGWKKQTSGYWTTIKDDKGIERLKQFFKGASYDTEAFLRDLESKL